MTPKEVAAVVKRIRKMLASQGGKARAKKLTKARRAEIASLGGKARSEARK